MRQGMNHPEKDAIPTAIELELQASKDLDVTVYMDSINSEI
jgi:hypothetical protein